MKELVKKFNAFSIWRIIGETELEKLSQLVIRVNYKHHLNQQFYPQDEFKKIYGEDIKALTDSCFYALYDDHDEIFASVKCQEWNRSTILAIEKDFSIDVKYFIHDLNFQPRKIFHIGSFVIDQTKITKDTSLRQKRLYILKLMMYYALFPVYRNRTNVFFCECDEKLFTKLNLLGVYPQIIGLPKEYLGSKTIPVYCDYNGIKKFFILNKNINNVS